MAMLGLPVGVDGPDGGRAAAAPVGAAATGAPAGPPDVLPPDGQWTVTLLSGETVEVTYEQSGFSPYPHRSTTSWSFPSSGDPDSGNTNLPLLTVDYELPLDVLNQPTSRTARFTVRHAAGGARPRIDRLRVWTSTDDGTTWEQATVRHRHGGQYRVTLPEVPAGTAVSLRVDARDVAGSRIEQTLHEAYFG